MIGSGRVGSGRVELSWIGSVFQAHAHDNLRVMQENVALVKEINELRKEMRNIRQQQRDRDMAGALPKPAGAKKGVTGGMTAAETEALRELQHQRSRIEELRGQIEMLQGQRILPRQASSELLPPIH
jgi:hypothetical protein